MLALIGLLLSGITLSLISSHNELNGYFWASISVLITLSIARLVVPKDSRPD
jgi:hypothetical protein